MTDILWAGGVVNPVTYIEQISYLIYLKMLDEEENRRELQVRLVKNGGTKSLYPLQAKRFRWSEWRFKSGEPLRNFIRDEVFPYMGSLVKEAPQISEYFRDAVLEITDPNVLKQVIDIIDSIDFAKLGTDVKGDIFEYLLTHLGQSALNGQFRTPRQIRTMMVRMLDPDFGDTCFDPAFGTGGLLIDLIEYVLARYSEQPEEVPIYGDEWLEARGQTLAQAKKEIPNLQTYRKGPGEKLPDWARFEASIYGIEVSRSIMRIAVMNLVLHGIRNAGVKRANSLSEMGGLTEDDLHRKYKIILSNPPFAGVLPKDSIRKDLPTTSKKSELLFLALMMDALAPGGRCAVIVPEGLLFGSTTSHKDLRKKLIDDLDLQAVISLPAGVFKPYAGVKTSVLVFRRPSAADNRKSATANRKPVVWFYEVLNDGYDPDKISGGVRPETPEKNDIPELLKQWQKYKDSGFKNPPGIEANTALRSGSEQPKCWWATVEAIAENDYNLAAGRYKPTVAEKPPDDKPADLIRDVLKLEENITDGLQRLLKDVEES